MKTATIYINGRPVIIKLSSAANSALQQRTKPLLAEMELYFSCLIRKKIRFYEDSDSTDQVEVSDGLSVRFRPVMTQSCHVSDIEGSAPPITDFEITKPEAFIPHWLHLDFKNNQWHGEFGYL